MIKIRLTREVPGVGFLLALLFLITLAGFLTADAVISSPAGAGSVVSLVPEEASAAIKVDHFRSREVLAVATGLALKARELNHSMGSHDLEKAVRAAFDNEGLNVSKLVDFARVLREVNAKKSNVVLGLETAAGGN